MAKVQYPLYFKSADHQEHVKVMGPALQYYVRVIKKEGSIDFCYMKGDINDAGLENLQLHWLQSSEVEFLHALKVYSDFSVKLNSQLLGLPLFDQAKSEDQQAA